MKLSNFRLLWNRWYKPWVTVAQASANGAEAAFELFKTQQSSHCFHQTFLCSLIIDTGYVRMVLLWKLFASWKPNSPSAAVVYVNDWCLACKKHHQQQGSSVCGFVLKDKLPPKEDHSLWLHFATIAVLLVTWCLLQRTRTPCQSPVLKDMCFLSEFGKLFILLR